MTIDLQLAVLLAPDAGGWLAHCLQLDLAEWGETLAAAQMSLLDVVRAHVEAAIADDDLAHHFHPGPAEVWKQFFQGDFLGEQMLSLDVPADVFPPVRVREASIIDPGGRCTAS